MYAVPLEKPWKFLFHKKLAYDPRMIHELDPGSIVQGHCFKNA